VEAGDDRVGTDGNVGERWVERLAREPSEALELPAPERQPRTEREPPHAAPLSSRCQIGLILPHKGQSERKCRALPDLALDLELLTVELDDLPGERQPEAGATRAPGDDVASSVEALAEVIEVGRCDAGAVVAHRHPGVTGAVEGSGADKHLGLVGRVLG